jgi:hypothetical protein
MYCERYLIGLYSLQDTTVLRGDILEVHVKDCRSYLWRIQARCLRKRESSERNRKIFCTTALFRFFHLRNPFRLKYFPEPRLFLRICNISCIYITRMFFNYAPVSLRSIFFNLIHLFLNIALNSYFNHHLLPLPSPTIFSQVFLAVVVQ